MDILIETERLNIRPLQLIDDAGMFEMDSDPEVHKYVGKAPVENIERSREVIEIVRQQYIDNGVGRWAVIEKSSNEFVGWTGLKLMKDTINGHTDFYDFGYRMMRRFWGKGYATESGIAAFRYGTDTMQLKEIFAMTDVDNLASRRVLEKVGLKYIETFNYDAEPNWRSPGEPTTWYKWSK